MLLNVPLVTTPPPHTLPLKVEKWKTKIKSLNQLTLCQRREIIGTLVLQLFNLPEVGIFKQALMSIAVFLNN